MAPVRPPRVAVALIAALLVLASTAAATARPARAATPSTAAPSAAAPASAEPTSAPVVAPAGSAGPATAAAEPDAVPGPRSEVLAGPQLSPADQAAVALADRRAAQAGAAPPGATASAPGSTFQVNYSGFTPAARAAFQRAVDAWAAVLVSPMPIVINATYTTLPPNVLGSAGPKALYRVNGGPFPGQLYPVALANALTSRDLDTAGEDIDATFSSTANWYLGTDGQVPQGQYDFTTVVLHELGHGLGFIGSATDDGTNGHLGLSGNPTFTTPYDMLAENGSGTALSTLANPSVALHSALTSSTWLDGSAIRAANGGRPARLYTPGTWSAGSSYSHFDDASHAPSDPDALMTPVLSGGEVHTVPGPLATAVMVDSGWSTVAAPTGTLTGTVRTASPAGAAAGVTVDVLRPSSTTIVASTTTDASGAYRLTGLGSASYQVRFSDGQGRWPTVWSGDSPTQGGSATVATVDGTTVTLDATLTWPGGSGFVAITPTRVLDTRFGPVPSPRAVGAPLGAGSTLDLPLGGVGGMPVDATAAVVNVTVTDTSAASFLAAYPTGVSRPNVSNLNWAPGATVANLVTVKLGAGGQVTLYNAVGTTSVIVDLVGYYTATAGSAFSGTVPTRLLDTRFGPVPSGRTVGQALAAGEQIDLPVAGVAGVPADATAVVLNVTATDVTGPTFVTAWPTGVAKPNASNLNVVRGATLPNLVTVKIGSGGRVSLGNAAAALALVTDVVGYFAPAAPSTFVPRSPIRVLDTRYGPVPSGVSIGAPIGGGQSVKLPVAGAGLVPTGATAVVLNITATDCAGPSFLSVWPAGVAKPNASNLNMVRGWTGANLVTVAIGSDGSIMIGNSDQPTSIIADIVGYYR